MGAAVFAAACISTAGHAGFVYVPDHEPIPQAMGDATSAVPSGTVYAAPGPAAHDGMAPRPGSPGWQVHSGEMLREVLGRWAGHAGIEVLFLTDRRYRLNEGRAFHGTFGEAMQALFSALSHLPHPPAGELRSDGRTLAVLHRARSAGEGR